MAAIDITPILKFMTDKGGSDLFFSTGTSIHIEIEGDTLPINQQVMTPGMIKEIAYAIMTPAQITEFETNLECNFAIGKTGSPMPIPEFRNELKCLTTPPQITAYLDSTKSIIDK